MRIHILSLPHTETTRSYSWCAFTEKNRKLAGMLHSVGHDVRLYAGEANEAPCTEHVQIFSRAEQASMFGHYNWKTDVFNEWSGPEWDLWNNRCIEAIRERMDPGDILGMSMGYSQRSVAEALPELMPVEVGIGYKGIWAPYRVFESYAWMHYLAASEPIDDIRYYDAVIPNSFDAEDFPRGEGSGDYFLFVGRFIRRKGIQIAAEMVERLGAKLVMAGQGVSKQGKGYFQGVDIEVRGKGLKHVGVVGPERRSELMGNARAVVCPSIYLEPFCGVAVEAMMCGTPVITTDWGAFTETVQQGKTGFRCRTLAEFTRAGRLVDGLDRDAIREYALARYSTQAVRHQYDDYLRRLQTLRADGWYTAED